jgi:hypothetical protein
VPKPPAVAPPPSNPASQPAPAPTAHSPHLALPPGFVEAARARAAALQKLQLRRTFIPIMLTLGTLFLFIGAGQWLTDQDYPYSAANMIWCAITLPILGAILLVMAVANVLYVRDKLAAIGRASKPR